MKETKNRWLFVASTHWIEVNRMRSGRLEIVVFNPPRRLEMRLLKAGFKWDTKRPDSGQADSLYGTEYSPLDASVICNSLRYASQREEFWSVLGPYLKLKVFGAEKEKLIGVQDGAGQFDVTVNSRCRRGRPSLPPSEREARKRLARKEWRKKNKEAAAAYLQKWRQRAKKDGE